MCGIAGYLNLNGEALFERDSHLPQMLRSIFHRGPDEEGKKVIGPAALGMTRLSIIDLSGGQQPISNENDSVWIVFNGEIYNFQELRDQLLAQGHKFKTQSDTEVIVHLYEQYGVDCVQHLEGMFAFAIWDVDKQRLFLARDRMGEKPLHWATFDGTFLFGSEIKSILCHPDAKRQLNPAALQEYLALEYVPAPSTMFKGIHKLPPAHYMIVEQGQVKVARYWSPDITPTKLSMAEAQERLLELLDRSIKGRLISEVPLGIFLSGGIDSSAITALAARHVSHKLKTFSIGFSDRSFDESDHAELVAKHVGTEHHKAQFTPELALSIMEDLWKVLDEPLADASILPTYFLSKTTRQHVTVALSGDGGDELFGGYPTYIAHRLANYWNSIPAPIREGIIAPAINSMPVSLNNLSLDYKMKRFIASAEESPAERHLKWMGAIPITQQASLIDPSVFDTAYGAGHSTYRRFSDLIGKLAEDRWLMKDLAHCRNSVNSAMRLDISCYLADDLLVKADRASMACSLEARMPFLAHPVAEFALTLPTRYKVNNFTTKYLLKKAIAPYLPAHIIKRPKKGFGIPVGKWLMGDFKVLVDEFLCESYIKNQSVLQWNHVRRLLDDHYGGTADRRKELWTLIMFQRWWHKFIESPISVPAREEERPVELHSAEVSLANSQST